eukprot:TRINITY_DN9155_c0_g1_i1.p1 TRINITY_DN9155_c0_g1~~TRINITY_DN9155_c0_g1_i1.p1  ORF type:complete len:121 (-),score=36.60 TRINITY_DN9155_c0_g1_i1:79-441(-)
MMYFFEDDELDDFMNKLISEQGMGVGVEMPSSRFGKHPNIDRSMDEDHQRICKDYLAEDPVYPEPMFRRRFRMPSDLFKKIVSDVEAHDSFFQQKRDAVGKMGASTIQKATVALGKLAYG